MSVQNAPAPEILAKARAGDIAGAIVAGETVLERHPSDAALRMFIGLLCCREGDLVRGIEHLRRVVAEEPGNAMARTELVRALLGTDPIAVLDLTMDADIATPQGRDMLRARAHAFQRMNRVTEAQGLFSALLDADADDFESQNGLGLALLAAGRSRAAITAFKTAIRLRPSGTAFWINLSRAAAAVSEWTEAAEAAEKVLASDRNSVPALLAAASARAGLDDKMGAKELLDRVRALGDPSPMLWTEIAETEVQLRNFSDAEMAFRRAIELDNLLVRAWVGLGNLIERLNRRDDLKAHLDAAAAAGVAEPSLALLHARLARMAGRYDDALALAQAAPAEGDGVARAQLIGTLADRLNDHETAFAAFAEANAAIASSTRGMEIAAETNLANYAAMRTLMTREWLARWPTAIETPADGRRDPLFIFGFPRSGTTLIDTMLSGHPDTAILEEESIIQRVSSSVGQVERVPMLSTAEIDALRARYFAEVDARDANAATKLIVDKEPFGLSSVLLLHRLFPKARFVFAERHPCDVVLSCWMTSFQFDHRVGSFHDLVSIARLYDAVLGFWTQCVQQLPIVTMAVRYERLIAAPEAELRQLAEFAGLDWRPNLMRNEENAANRAYIGSPSYAQVGERIYKHAAGRWMHYRPWIDVILPILNPWIRQLGYDML